MPSEKMLKRDIRMSDELWDAIGETSHLIGYADERGEKSSFVRDMISDIAAEWKCSPYICNQANHLVFISKDGHAFGRITNHLRLNSPRERIPTGIRLKPEKILYYERNKPPGSDLNAWMQSLWLLNYFSVAENGDILTAETDRRSRIEKYADLRVHRQENTELHREMVIALQDYVQWSETSIEEADLSLYDRIDAPIDFPTKNLTLQVIIDEDLYALAQTKGAAVPSLNLEFRNREGARFSSAEMMYMMESPPIFRAGAFPEEQKTKEEEIGEVVTAFQEMKDRVTELTNPEKKAQDGDPFVIDEAARKTIQRSLKLPERYLFAQLKWKTPHLGLVACVHWGKPPKKS